MSMVSGGDNQAAFATCAAPHRIAAIDLLRGLVIILMALDHVRDFINRDAMTALPTDLASTTPLLFATRWITHVCAPAFALAAGLGAWLALSRGGSRRAASSFLVKRGLWLILLELTVMRFAYYFSFSPDNAWLLLVFWSLGLSMLVLAALVWLPAGAVAVIGAAGILLHPMLDPVDAAALGRFAPFWNVLHEVGAFQLFGLTFVTPYPLVPWASVMALGFGLGPLYRDAAAATRKRLLLAAGILAIATFLILRLFNVYGDPVPWSIQDSPAFTVMSFLNLSKYPASPAFLAMTIGIALLLLAALEGVGGWRARLLRPARVFGKVPLFFYVVHFYVAHLIASALALMAYGAAATGFMFLPYPSMGGAARRFPSGFGYDLVTTYAVWIAVICICYPLCRRYANIKANGQGWWWRYL